MNIVFIIIDSLRQDYVGYYGNDWIKTPHLDSLAKESMVFTHAYPESLPSLQARRAIHTGSRVFPFIVGKWESDFSQRRITITEILKQYGYHTSIITDGIILDGMQYHFIKLSGFNEKIWIKGKEDDPLVPVPSQEEVESHIPEGLRTKENINSCRRHLMHVYNRRYEEEHSSALIFREAVKWLERNHNNGKFFLVIDSSTPHPVWHPPIFYRKIYDPEEDVMDFWIDSIRADLLTPRQLKRLKANYAGEVTLVDCWLGYFLERMRNFGLMENTLIALISDHGHCIGEHNIVGKQGHPLSKEIADLVLMIRHPKGEGAGKICNSFIYNYDLSPTILNRLGIKKDKLMDGKDVWPLALGKEKEIYNHITCGWGPFVMVRDKRYWYNAYLWGESVTLYNLENDPHLKNNIAQRNPDICQKMKNLAIADAGGKIPKYLLKRTKKLRGKKRGWTPFLGKWK